MEKLIYYNKKTELVLYRVFLTLARVINYSLSAISCIFSNIVPSFSGNSIPPNIKEIISADKVIFECSYTTPRVTSPAKIQYIIRNVIIIVNI